MLRYDLITLELILAALQKPDVVRRRFTAIGRISPYISASLRLSLVVPADYRDDHANLHHQRHRLRLCVLPHLAALSGIQVRVLVVKISKSDHIVGRTA